jgi:two-component system sensor histidine kinase/response regulator
MSTIVQVPGPPVKILIAEDSPTQAQRLQHILEQQGYQVRVAANGHLALEAMQHFTPALIISDVVMPEMDGYELSRRVKADPSLGDIPVILVTTLSDPQDVIRGLECRADNFVLKPYDEHYLLSRVQFVLVNREMHRAEQGNMGVEIFFNGQKHFITADRLQILNLLLSTYDAAIQRNKELNRSQEELQLINAKLEAANKELESFSYSVSHDLRGPLRAIDGYSQILEEDHAAGLDEEGRRLLGVIRDSSQKMGALIDDLLAFSRLGRKAMTAAEVNMNALVKEILRELQAGSGAKLPPRMTVADLPPAWGDRTLLKQVWINLLSNAIKFAGTKDAPAIAVCGNIDGTEHVYSVKDGGVGFDMKYYNKLFGVFQRLHSQDEFPGTGVGLAIVRRVVTRHGGRVWAEGKINEGATFYFALPRNETQGEEHGRDATG